MRKKPENTDTQWVDQVSSLAEQVRILALNLAINLARSKNQIRDLAFLEPDFTKLVYGAVEVIKEVSTILRAFQNEEKMVYAPPPSSGQLERIETSLNEILKLSRNILNDIASIKDGRGEVDNYI